MSVRQNSHFHNPEFLTARTAFEDFHNQKHIVLGKGIVSKFEDVNIVKEFYDLWSFKVIPKLGKFIANNEDAYKYLIESIRMFPDQDQLSSMLIKSKFERVKYRNLSKGIASLHSGWKF